ncbi:hypothetical protein OPQ81_011336 [Rhizoctonia solani]|nr:hypothetical protein OPQ81_011336 [Rhizoctonia solani]
MAVLFSWFGLLRVRGRLATDNDYQSPWLAQYHTTAATLSRPHRLRSLILLDCVRLYLAPEIRRHGVIPLRLQGTILRGPHISPPPSPTLRPVSPNYRRTSTAPRFSRTTSYNPDGRRENIRSASVASSNMGRRAGRADTAFSETEQEDADSEDEPGPSRGRTAREPLVDADDELSEPEDPITVKGRQSMINVEHPFGLRIWKPALYKKSRTVNRNAETDLHSAPSAVAERHLIPGNLVWTLVFGWWLALIFIVVSGPLWLLPRGGRQYGSLVFGLGWYIFWPFGKYVEGDLDEDERRQFEAELAEAEGLTQPHANEDYRTSTVETVRPNRDRSVSDAARHEQTGSWVPPTERTSLLQPAESSATPPSPDDSGQVIRCPSI